MRVLPIGSYRRFIYCLGIALLLIASIVAYFSGYDIVNAKVTGANQLQFREVSSGNYHSCGIASDNKAYCWGRNNAGQLGNGNTTNQSTPVPVARGEIPANATIQKISAGGSYTCAIASNDRAYCWGNNADGQLGDGTNNNSSTPVAVLQGSLPSGSIVNQISAGLHHTCAIASNNRGYCWGRNADGQLGNGTNTSSSTPVVVSQGAMPSGAMVRQIVPGNFHTCAIAMNDQAYCWGSGSYGRIGNGSSGSQNTPVAVSQGAMPSGAMVRQIAAGYAHSCAISSDDKAYCWGRDDFGQLGDGAGANQNVPVAVVQGALPSGSMVREIMNGYNHTCVIASNERMYCWGENTNGQLGNGSTSTSSSPVLVSQGSMPSGAMGRGLAVGHYHNCVLGADNKSYCWGRGDFGELGNNGSTDQTTPVVTSAIYRQIELSQTVYRAYGPSSSATPGSPLGASSVPTTLTSVAQEFRLRIGVTNTQDTDGLSMRSVSTGGGSSCGIDYNDLVYCWGLGSAGRLGNGSTGSVTTPTLISQGDLPSGYTMKQVDVSLNHACAIASDNKAYCWGSGASGQLGNGTTISTQSTPVAISLGAMPGGSTILQVSAGEASACAIASNGKPYCWGAASNGRLGNGTTTPNQSTPVAVSQGAMPGGFTVREIAVGNAHACVIASDDKAYCWGRGAEGQIGDGGVSNRTTPVAVSLGAMPAGSTILHISAGGNQTCAIASDYKAYCWGDSVSNAPVAVPQGAIPTSSRVTQIKTATYHTCAIAESNNRVYCWGRGAYGRLGNGSAADQGSPVAVSQGALPSNQSVIQISTGTDNTCAISVNHKAYCWGMGTNGRLGNGDPNDALTPVAVSRGDREPGGITMISVAIGRYHSCGIATDHKAYCWGLGTSGQLGNGGTSSSSSPVAVSQGAMPAGSVVRQVTVGAEYSCAIASNSRPYCWGLGTSGELGNGGTSSSSTPVAVSQGAMPNTIVRQISAGENHTCVISSNNRAYCWGVGANGRLGEGNTVNRSTPVVVSQGAMPSGARVRQVAAGYFHTCAIASDNKAYCWGYGSQGRVGNGGTGTYSTPVAVSQGAMPAGADIVQITAGNWHSCAIASNNKAYCWGDADYGQLGNGATGDYTTPVAVSQGAMPSGANILQISAGAYHTCAVTATNNRMYCWGMGANGRLGEDDTADRSTPVAVLQGALPNGLTARQLAAGYDATCAIASDNKAYCWGNGANGRLGTGSTSQQTLPALVNHDAITDLTSTVNANQLNLTVQVAPLGGKIACDLVTSGWANVTANTSVINWGSTPPTNTTTISSFGSDPTAPTSAGFVHQSVVRSGTFTNNVALPPQGTGLWDVVLNDRTAMAGTAYCLRTISNTGGTSIDSYDFYPHIITATGSLDIQFVNGSGTPITAPATNTAFSSALTAFTVQTATASLVDVLNKQLEAHNSFSNNGWSISLAATGGPSAAWTSGGNSYPYNSANSNNGQLSVNMSSASRTGHGTDPTGTACGTTGTTLGTGTTAFTNVVSSITLMTGSPSSQFNCTWRLRDIILSQTIPSQQAAGNYTLNMTATIVAN